MSPVDDPWPVLRTARIRLSRTVYDTFTADVAYQFIKQKDRRGRVRERLPGETAADVNTGVYQTKAHLVSLTLRAYF